MLSNSSVYVLLGIIIIIIIIKINFLRFLENFFIFITGVS
jgi:hypothetical protein